MDTLQKFTPEYLEHCQKMSTREIVDFLDQFRQLHYLESSQFDHPKEITLQQKNNLLENFYAKPKLNN